VQRLRAACEQHREAPHEKTRALARELLNDWEAIFAVLAHPELPLTHNEAERALRHWVIARKLSFGTRTAEGSRAYALLASVIETCRKRHRVPWEYLADVIRARRAGQSAPPLPAAASTG
jgi:transposase